MSEQQLEDRSSTALTEIERLLPLWDDLKPKSGITHLIHQSIANLSLHRQHADAAISSQSFSRLITIHSDLEFRGIAGTSLIEFMADEFTRKLQFHSIWLLDKTLKSELQLFEDLDHWTTLNTMLEKLVPTHTILRWIRNIKCIVSGDVDALVALPVSSNVSPDSLRVIEIGAKLLKALPYRQCVVISHVVDSQIKALTASSAHTPESNFGNDSANHAILEPNDSQILNPQTGNELTGMDSNHVNSTVALRDEINQLREEAQQLKAVKHGLQQESTSLTAEKSRLEDQFHQLQERALQLEAVNHGLQQENTSLDAEKIRLEGQVRNLTDDVQASEIGMSVLWSRINDLQSKNAGLEKELIASKDRDQIAIRKLEDEVASLKPALSDYRNDDRIYDDSFKSRAEKLTEELAEAAEDKAALARDVAKLAVDKANVEEALAESEDSKTAMSSDIHKLGTKIDRLQQELKDSSDSLEEAEDDRAALSRNVRKLTLDNAFLQSNLDQIRNLSASIQSVNTGAALQSANANEETDTVASSLGMLTPTSSTQTTPG